MTERAVLPSLFASERYWPTCRFDEEGTSRQSPLPSAPHAVSGILSSGYVGTKGTRKARARASVCVLGALVLIESSPPETAAFNVGFGLRSRRGRKSVARVCFDASSWVDGRGRVDVARGGAESQGRASTACTPSGYRLGSPTLVHAEPMADDHSSTARYDVGNLGFEAVKRYRVTVVAGLPTKKEFLVDDSGTNLLGLGLAGAGLSRRHRLLQKTNGNVGLAAGEWPSPSLPLRHQEPRGRTVE
jgi:hypothetical protein